MFGLWRRYWHKPTYDPDAFSTLKDLEDGPPKPLTTLAFLPSIKQTLSAASETFSLDRFNDWVMGRPVTEKTDAEVRYLVHDIILDDRFVQSISALQGYDPIKERNRIDQALTSNDSPFVAGTFKTTSVDIQVPSGSPSVPPKTIPVPGLHYRKITDIIKEAFSDQLALHYHYTPFELRAESSSDVGHCEEGTRVYSEVYNSDAFIKEHDHLQRHGKTESPCTLEKVIAALMVWSDSTHLAQFGTASLWPIYLLFGNLSKYLRAKQDSGAIHHVAYIPKVRCCNIYNGLFLMLFIAWR